MAEGNMPLGLSRSLRSLVSDKFNQAVVSQGLIFSDTYLTIIRSKSGIPYQLRYCPALSRKPTDNKQTKSPPNQESEPPKKKFDPFENPSPDLLIARIPDPNNHTHNLVLNKYPVIPNHFILSTRENKPQTNLLEAADLSLTYACLQAWHESGRHNLFAFFNSGESSGASQPHRHLQFLSVEDMRGTAPASEWDLLCERMSMSVHSTLPLFQDPSLPIVHLATPVSTSLSSAQLHDKYLLLLRASALLINPKDTDSISPSELLNDSALASTTIASAEGKTAFSYNLALTKDTMAILPRRAEDAIIPEIHNNDSSRGVVSINGTILAGTLMVKNEAEWDVLKDKPELLDDMLQQIGFPQSVCVSEASYQSTAISDAKSSL